MKNQPQLPPNHHKYFKLLIFFLFLLIVTQNQAGQTIKTQQPWTAEAGAVTFTTSSVDTFNTVGDLKFGSTFAVTLRILNIIPQTFQIVLGYRKLDALFSPQGSTAPSTSIEAPPLASNTFNIIFFIEDDRLLTQVKANYLLIGYQLVLSSMVQSQFIQIMSPTYSACDALGGPQTCTYNIPAAIPALTYKIYLSISALDSQSKSTSSVTTPPSQTSTATKLDSRVKSFTLTNIEIEFKNDKIKFTTLKLYAIFVHPTMFDQTVIKKTMFFEVIGHITSSAPLTKVFAQKVLNTNYFVGFLSFKGFKWSFDVSEFTPNDFFLGASINSGSTLFDFNGFVMYGYTTICTGLRNCLSCYIGPDFNCTQCAYRFISSTPLNTDNTCQCPAPLTIVSGVCDNHQYGCIIAIRLPDKSVECIQCDFNLMLILNPTTKMCQCKANYTMDANFVCQEICGDGIVVNSQCDDGNIFSGDGCSSSCVLEKGFDCDTTIQPTFCKSQTMLFYRIDRITKETQSNKAIVKLYLPFQSTYPFPVLKEQFDPTSTLMNFRIILSRAPYTEIIITDLTIVDIDPDNCISFEFSFSQSIEGTEGMLLLNYQNTKYFNYTQNLGFTLVGDNAALIYEAQIESYKTISYGLLAGTIINSLLLFIGFISPKFIGLQSILTLQLIFFSQTLIYSHMKFPVGFMFLETLQYSAGYNDIFDFTDYQSKTETAKKMNYIKRHKTIIENFNLNFIFLLVGFIVLVIFFVMRAKKDREALEEKDHKTPEEKNLQNQEKLLKKINKEKENEGLSLRKINDITFYIANQIAFWLFLPLVAAIAAEIVIQNQNVIPDSDSSRGYYEQKAGQFIAIPSFFMIFMIIMSNFGNIWQSSESMSNAFQRIQKIYYKRWLFVYLSVVAFLIFFFNSIYFMKVYTSMIVFLIQVIHIIVIMSINPYKKGLKVHTIGLLINNAIYLAFLVIINFINYMPQMEPAIAMFFGYAMVAFCVVSIIITIIRLYYELRYGRELEMQLEEERIQREKQEKLRKQAQLKSRMQKMQNDAKMKISDQQRLRQRNVYLHQNQVQQDKKKQLINWLDNRPIDKKIKQAYFFQKFTQKPLEWLKIHDPAKYELKINELNQHLHNDLLKAGQKQQDEKYQVLTAQLKKEVKKIKKVQEERVRMHEKGIVTDPNYSMNIHRIHQEKMVHQAYELKD